MVSAPSRAEHRREERRLQLAEHHVAVGHGQRAALAVAGGARVGAGAARPDAVAALGEGAHRAAAGGDGADAQHRRSQAHAADGALQAAFVLTGVVRDVGRGAAHVEGDQPLEAGAAAGPHGAHDASGGPGEDAVLAAEQVRVGEAAVTLHEAQAHAAQLRADAVHVAPQDGGEVGVHHGRLAAADELLERARLVRGGDLREAGGARQLRHAPLVLGVAVAVHEGDGHGLEAFATRRLESASRPVLVEGADDRPVGADALVHLEDARVQRLGQAHVQGEDVGPVLVADAQGVAEPARGDQQGGLAAPFEQRVGGHGRAHAHLVDQLSRDRCAGGDAEQLTHPLDGGVGVARRVLGEQLARQRARRRDGARRRR